MFHLDLYPIVALIIGLIIKRSNPNVITRFLSENLLMK